MTLAIGLPFEAFGMIESFDRATALRAAALAQPSAKAPEDRGEVVSTFGGGNSGFFHSPTVWTDAVPFVNSGAEGDRR